MSRTPDASLPRRDFLKLSAVAGLAGALGPGSRSSAAAAPPAPGTAPQTGDATRAFAAPYVGTHLNRVAFPLGGLGAGMICLEGTGALSHVSIRHKPDVFNEPLSFAAISVRGTKPVARVLEGPVPAWKLFGNRGSAMGATGSTFGLPRFAGAEFAARFPFATVKLTDDLMPLQVELTGWSPFTPPDADNSSLPVAALEYRFTNPTAQAVDAVFSYNTTNFLVGKEQSGEFVVGAKPVAKKPPGAIGSAPGGFVLSVPGTPESPWEEANFAATVDDPAVRVNHAWFRGRFWDALTMAWRDVETGACFERPPATSGPPVPGASLFVPFSLAPGASKTIVLRLCWHAPATNLRYGKDANVGLDKISPAERYYRPWYAAQFAGIAELAAHWAARYEELRAASRRFADCLFDTTLPPEITEAVTANLAILKSPTILRQADGRMWAWEGCGDNEARNGGTCEHVWNYAQAVAHLFPALERTLRQTEFGESQDEHGNQTLRASLPIRPAKPGFTFTSAADGQLGGIIKVHRDWRISGDTAWLRALWPKVRQSLDFCIETWDPDRKGWLVEPHHNTYDIYFWGPDGMCSSIYLAALQAAVRMGRALGDDIGGYETLLAAGLKRVETELFDGEYFFQKTEWKGLRDANRQLTKHLGGDPSPESLALVEAEGPKYQYGPGCLSDGVLGAWFAQVGGLGQVLDPVKVTSHLRAVHRHNLKCDLSTHANPQRPSYAAGHEGGLLLCSWPKGGKPSLPFVYSDEVWTGIEHQVASHLIMMGAVDEGLEIVRTCRARYDGRVRDPFDEYEAGHWYARALSSYALLQAMSGARYDAVDQVLHLAPPRVGDFRCFLATATGYGTVGVRDGKPFLDVRSGTVPIRKINYSPSGKT